MPVYILDDEQLDFPDPNLAETDPDGLLAVGGDLSVQRLLNAYQSGIFPWFTPDDPILWWSPNPRVVLFPEDFKVNRSFKKILNRDLFKLKINTNFSSVIKHCAAPRGEEDGVWITDEMQAAYTELHQLGFAHSYECWKNNELVGGLYGVRLGPVFFAESMFRKVDNASKMAVYFLTQEMLRTNGTVIDIQMMSPHLKQWGAVEIPRAEFLSKLPQNLE